MHFESTPLGARCAYAMSEIVQPLDPSKSLDYLAVAIECARDAGVFADTGRVPFLIANIDVLRMAYLDGLDTCADLLGDDQLLVQSSWIDSDASHQTRIRIIKIASSYKAEVEVLFSGGDREVVVVGCFDSQEVAEKQARLHEVAWHEAPEPTDAELARFEINLTRLSAELGEFPELQLAA